MKISNEATKAAQEILEDWRHISSYSELWVSEIIQIHFNKVRKPLVDELQNIVNCDLAGMRKDFGNDTDRQFRIWAQNRARHALDALAKVKP